MAHMLYVELVLYPTGEIVSVNPLQVIGVKPCGQGNDKVSLLFPVGEWVVLGSYALVKAVLSGHGPALEQYEKSWIEPAKKEGPRRVQTL